MRALELGYELIVQGNHLFEELSDKEQAGYFRFYCGQGTRSIERNILLTD